MKRLILGLVVVMVVVFIWHNYGWLRAKCVSCDVWSATIGNWPRRTAEHEAPCRGVAAGRACPQTGRSTLDRGPWLKWLGEQAELTN